MERLIVRNLIDNEIATFWVKSIVNGYYFGDLILARNEYEDYCLDLDKWEIVNQ